MARNTAKENMLRPSRKELGHKAAPFRSFSSINQEDIPKIRIVIVGEIISPTKLQIIP